MDDFYNWFPPETYEDTTTAPTVEGGALAPFVVTEDTYKGENPDAGFGDGSDGWWNFDEPTVTDDNVSSGGDWLSGLLDSIGAGASNALSAAAKKVGASAASGGASAAKPAASSTTKTTSTVTNTLREIAASPVALVSVAVAVGLLVYVITKNKK